MQITAAQIKELREKTGAGIVDTKNALVENNGDMEKAMEFLRQKGIASADKKMGRIAAEGLVDSYVDDKCGALVEVNCETDFVAKNSDFQEFVACIAKAAALKAPKTLDEFNTMSCDCGTSIEEAVKEKISTIGEKITIRRFVRYEGTVATYIHNNKIGVLLDYKGDAAIAKDICLHIASCEPEFVSRAQIDKSIIDEETRIEMGKEDLANKPDNIKAKIVEGRVNKLMASKCLMEQAFVKNPDITIEQLVEGKVEIKAFSRYALGEGLEKRQENFAEEVMNQMK